MDHKIQTETESLSAYQSRRLKAALAVYRAELAVDEALDEFLRVDSRYTAGARLVWLLREQQLDEAKEKRIDEELRIRREELEAQGLRWLEVVR